MAEGTIMVLKVDLGCAKCRRKIKKLLCKYHEIRDQVYNEKEDTVIIKVVCCNPERIRQKLICKGGKLIKSIEIKPPSKPPSQPPSKPPSQPPLKPETPPPSKPPSQPPSKPPSQPPSKPPSQPPLKPETPPPSKPPSQPPSKPEKPPPSKPPSQPPSKPDPAPPPVTGYPPMFYPRWVWCKQCFEGQWGGPCHCHHGSCGIPYQQPPSSYDGYVKLTPSYDGWPSGCRCDRSHGCRCECYTENYPSCTLM